MKVVCVCVCVCVRGVTLRGREGRGLAGRNPKLELLGGRKPEGGATCTSLSRAQTCEPGKLRGVRSPWLPWRLWPGSTSRGKALAWPIPGVLLLLPSRARPGSEFSLITPAPQSRWHSLGPGRRRGVARKAAPAVCFFICVCVSFTDVYYL